MRRVAPLVRAAPVALLLALTSVGAGLGSARAEGIDPEPAAEASPDPAAPDPAPADAGPSAGAIVMACFGVLFGGALALWQIRGMKNRG